MKSLSIRRLMILDGDFLRLRNKIKIAEIKNMINRITIITINRIQFSIFRMRFKKNYSDSN